MSVPAINEFHRPILEVLLDVDGEVSYPDITRKLIHRLSISEEDLKEKTPAGRSKVTSHIYNAAFWLKRAGLVDQPAVRTLRITEQGGRYLTNHHGSITKC